MTASDGLERRLADHYAAEASQRAPDRVLEAALATIDVTRQRRGLVRVPWRFPTMNSYARWGVAAVAVIALGAVGLTMLLPGSGQNVGGPGPSASPSPSRSPTSSAAGSSGTLPSPYVKPALADRYDSDAYGFSIAYPDGWVPRPASEPWTESTMGGFDEPALDVLYDPSREGHLFLVAASRPLAGQPFEQWAQAILADRDCAGGTEPITVDGASGLLGDCGIVVVAAGDRGYLFGIYVADDPEFDELYFLTWLVDEFVPTIDLRPEDARPPSSAAPTGSAAPSAS
jgi:hypothetical protein